VDGPAAVGSRQISRGQRAAYAQPAGVARQRRRAADVIPAGDVAQPVVDAAATSPSGRQPSQRHAVHRLAGRLTRPVAVRVDPPRPVAVSGVRAVVALPRRIGRRRRADDRRAAGGAAAERLGLFDGVRRVDDRRETTTTTSAAAAAAAASVSVRTTTDRPQSHQGKVAVN